MMPVRFVPTGSLFWLLIKNLLLTVVTLGFYRFWARTALRRYLWSSVEIAGDPVEYTGRGIELFLGFLTVLAIFIPISIVYSALEVLIVGQVAVVIALKLLTGVVFLMLIVVAQFRARRYRLSRTVWRGIRAGQGGSTWVYLFLTIGWSLLSLVTFGIAVPWARRAQERYRINNTFFGDHRLAFVAPGRPLIGRWLLVLALGSLPTLAGLALIGVAASGIFGSPRGSPTWIHAGYQAAIGVVLVLCAAVAGSISYAVYAVAEFRYFMVSTRLGEARFRSRLGVAWVIWRHVSFTVAWGVIMILSAVALAWTLSSVFGLTQATLPGLIGSAPFIAITTLYLIVMLTGAHILHMIFVRVAVYRKGCETLSIENIAALDVIGRSVSAPPQYGEGLADSFDIGAI